MIIIINSLDQDLGERAIEKIRVMLVEDDLEWQSGLKSFFSKEPTFEIVACADSVQSCLQLLKTTPVDIVLMDIILNDSMGTGLDATLDITHLYPTVKVIMVSSLEDDDEVFNESFLNGAYDYVYKNDFEQIPSIITKAMNDHKSKYGARLKKLVYDKKKELLTPYDEVLLKLILEGRTQQEIAKLNNVSLGAIKKQVSRILKKFNWSGSTKDLADKCNKWRILE